MLDFCRFSTCASRSRSRRQPLVARGGFPDSVRRHGTARPLRFMTDDLLATSMGLNPAHFQPHLKPLRLVSAEIKETCCLVADEISRARRSRILAFMTTFPDIVAELDMRLVEIDFEELTSMCAKMFVSCAAATEPCIHPSRATTCNRRVHNHRSRCALRAMNFSRVGS